MSPFLKFHWLVILLLLRAAPQAQCQTLAEALDQPTMDIVTGTPNILWQIVAGAEAHDGIDAVRCAVAPSMIETTVQGPGKLSFWWKADLRFGSGKFALVEVGEVRAIAGAVTAITGVHPWQREEIVLAAGTHRLQWKFTSDLTNQLVRQAGETVWLDQLDFLPTGQPVSVAEGLDATNLTWTFTGRKLWKGVQLGADPAQGDVAILSVPPLNPPGSEAITLRTSLPSAGVVSFRGHRRLSNYQGRLEVRVAGQMVAEVSELERDFSLSVSGPSQFSLVTSGEITELAEWVIDNFRFASASATIGAAVDDESGSWTTPVESPGLALIDPLTSHDGVDSVHLPSNPEASWIKRTVEGPAQVESWVKNSSNYPAVISVDNQSVQILPVGNWTKSNILLGPGPHQVGWGTSTSGGTYVDQVQVTAFPSVSAAEAADSSGLSWTGVGAASQWQALSDPARSFDGVDVLRAGPGLTQASGGLDAGWSGAGTLNFRWWRSANPTNQNQNFSMTLDGLAGIFNSKAGTWESVQWELGAGNHTASWQFNYPFLTDHAMVDAVSWVPGGLANGGFANALDCSLGPWMTKGDALWFVSTGGTFDGVDAVSSPALTIGQESRLATIISGEVKVTFRWKSTGSPSAWVEVGYTDNAVPSYENAARLAALTGETGWVERSIILAGAHAKHLRWTVRPLNAGGCPAGAIMLDQLSITPWSVADNAPAAQPQPLAMNVATALGLPSQAFTFTGRQAPEATIPAESHDGVSAAKFTSTGVVSGVNQTASLTTSVEGPFELAFWWQHVYSGVGSVPAPVGVYVNGEKLVDLNYNTTPLWQHAVFARSSPGTYLIEWRITAPSSFTGKFLLDEVSLLPYGAVNTLSAAADGVGVDWAVAHVEGYGDLAAAGLNHDGQDAVRFGPGTASKICYVNGPAVVRWWWRHELQDGSVRANGITAKIPRGEWRPAVQVLLGTGRYPVTFQGVSARPTDSFWIDEVSVNPYVLPSVEEALGSTGITVTPEPAALWKTNWDYWNSLYYDSTVTSPLPTVTAAFNGPGALWSSRMPGFSYSLDGVAQDTTNLTDLASVAAGPHVAVWTLTGTPAGQDSSLRQVRFLPEVDVAAALDFSAALTLSAAPPGMMGLRDSELSKDAEDFAVSPALGLTATNLTFQFIGPGKLEFWYRSLGGQGLAQMWIDGVLAKNISMSEAWFLEESTLGSGAHTITLGLMRSSAGTGPLRILLDRFRWVSDAAISADPTAALDSGSLAWTTRSESPMTESAVSSVFGGSALASQVLAAGESTWLETTIPQSGTITFHHRLTGSGNFPNGWRLAVLSENLIGDLIASANWAETGYHISTTTPIPFRVLLQNGNSTGLDGDGKKQLWIDKVRFVPDAAATSSMAAVLDSPNAITWTNSVDPWLGWADDSTGFDAGVVFGPTASRNLKGSTPGPGFLSFKWRVLPYSSYRYAGTTDSSSRSPVLVSSKFNRTIYFTNSPRTWANNSVFLLPQWSDFEFRFLSSPQPPDTMWLDDVQWTPAPTTTVAEALDAPTRTWTTGGTGTWFALAEPTQAKDLQDSLISGALTAGQSCWTETTVAAASDVTFDWKVSSQTADKFTFSVNGTAITNISGTGGLWATYTQRLRGAGPFVLRWTYAKSASGNGGSDTAWLDQVAITPNDTSNLNTAIDNPSLTITTDTNATLPFVIQSNAAVALVGPTYLEVAGPSPLTTPPSTLTSGVNTTVSGTGVVAFDWYSSGGAFTFRVDGVTKKTFSGSNKIVEAKAGWNRIYHTISTAGAHTLRWQFDQNSFQSPQVARLDNFRFEQPQNLSTLNSPNVSWTTGTPDWKAYAPSDRPFFLAPAFTTGQSIWIEASVTGPAAFSFESGGNLIIQIDGVSVPGLNSAPTRLYQRKVFVPSGIHRLRWTSIGPDPTSLPSWVAHPRWEAPSMPWIPTVLGADSLVWLGSGLDALTVTLDSPLEPGNEVLRFGSSYSSGSFNTTLQALLPLPGKMVGWVKLRSALSNLGMFDLTGPFYNEWLVRESPAVKEPGFQSIELSASGIQPAGYVDLDAVRFVPAPQLTVAEATESGSLEWTPDPTTAGWIASLDPVNSHDGIDSLRAFVADQTQSRHASATITGPVKLSFWGAGFTFRIDGIDCADCSQVTESGVKTNVEIGSGTHQIEWIVAGSAFGPRMGYLDEIKVEPITAGSGFIAVGASSPVAVFYDDQAWSVPSSGRLLHGSIPLWGATSPLRFLLTGSSVLSFNMDAPNGVGPRSPNPATANYGYILPTAGMQIFPLDFYNQNYPASWTALNGRDIVLRDFTVTNLTNVSLQQALQTPNPVTTLGTPAWQGYMAPGTGVSFAAVPVAVGGAAVRFRTSFTGPGDISFTNKNSGNTNHANMGVSLDGVFVSGLGSSDYGQFSLYEARTYLVEWGYAPTSAGIIIVDNLRWTPFRRSNDLLTWINEFGMSYDLSRSFADPDADGRTNLLEFALGGIPNAKDASTQTLEPIVESANGMQRTGVALTARHGFGVSYQLEQQVTSNGASSWQTLPVAPLVTTIDSEWSRFRFIDPVPWSGATRIVRLRVVLAGVP